MGTIVSFTEELTSPVHTKKPFTTLILNATNLIPKLIPQAVKSIKIIKGNGDPRSITRTMLADVDQVKYVKHRIDALDKENMTYSYIMIESDDLIEKFESMAFKIKFQATLEGGCKGTNVRKNHPRAGTDIKKEEIKARKDKALALLMAVVAYVIANPDAYA